MTQEHEGGNVVDAMVMRLRRRIGDGPTTPTIESVRGVGYVLRAPLAVQIPPFGAADHATAGG